LAKETIVKDRSLLRLGAACGISSVVLEITGLVVGVASAPAFVDVALGSSEREISRAFASPAPTGVWVGLYLEVIAFLLFIVFVARLWDALRRAEGGTGWISAAALGAGVLFAGTSLLALAFWGVQDYQAGSGVDVRVAMTLTAMHLGTYYLSWAVQALFLAITAVVALGMRALPRWLGWSAAAISVASLAAVAAPTGDLAEIPAFLFLIWIVAVSVVLMRRKEEPSLALTGAPSPSA